MINYEARLKEEVARFDAEIDVHDLPEIFHYWSNRYLKPKLVSQGYDNIEDFFVREIAAVDRRGMPLKVISLGSGDCAVELNIACQLHELGRYDVEFTCLDISSEALMRGKNLAKKWALKTNLHSCAMILILAYLQRLSISLWQTNHCITWRI